MNPIGHVNYLPRGNRYLVQQQVHLTLEEKIQELGKAILFTLCTFFTLGLWATTLKNSVRAWKKIYLNIQTFQALVDQENFLQTHQIAKGTLKHKDQVANHWQALLRQQSKQQLRTNGLALEFIKHQDTDLILEAVKNCGSAIKFANQQFINKQVCLEAVEQDGLLLFYAPEEFKNDKDIVEEAVSNNGAALQHASNHLKNEKEIVQLSLCQSGLNLQYASDSLKSSVDIVISAVRNDPQAIKFAKGWLYNNRHIGQQVLKKKKFDFQKMILRRKLLKLTISED
jgi:hypothetical protein